MSTAKNSIVAANVAAWRAQHGRTGAAAAAVRQGVALPRNIREALACLPVRRGR